MINKKKPFICITRGTGDRFPNSPELYIKSIEETGGEAEYICPGVDLMAIVKKYDGLLIPGGKDISPLLYNEMHRYNINPEENKRTLFEIEIFRIFLDAGKPILGICYGMQLINVALKGTLYQDINSQIRGALDHRKGVHSITVETNAFIQVGEYEVNSSHHQAIKDAGIGVTPFAYSGDGLIEGIWIEGQRFIAGVQWHPERMDNYISNQIFRYFVGASCED